MRLDNITEIGVDIQERLYIKPEKERFEFIWRSATGVHWDSQGLFLYSPKPREWSYTDWYKNIIGAVKSEYGCNLMITDNTAWVNIPEDVKRQIVEYNER